MFASSCPHMAASVPPRTDEARPRNVLLLVFLGFFYVGAQSMGRWNKQNSKYMRRRWPYFQTRRLALLFFLVVLLFICRSRVCCLCANSAQKLREASLSMVPAKDHDEYVCVKIV